MTALCSAQRELLNSATGVPHSGEGEGGKKEKREKKQTNKKPEGEAEEEEKTVAVGLIGSQVFSDTSENNTLKEHPTKTNKKTNKTKKRTHSPFPADRNNPRP